MEPLERRYFGDDRDVPPPREPRTGLVIGPGAGGASDVAVVREFPAREGPRAPHPAGGDRAREPGHRPDLPPGPYAGRGPRGYRRPDERIRDEICERLARAGDVDASDVEVDVRDGDVLLAGTVGDRRERRRADDIAASAAGVRDVFNHLRVRARPA